MNSLLKSLLNAIREDSARLVQIAGRRVDPLEPVVVSVGRFTAGPPPTSSRFRNLHSL